jgi:hypothetical protein
LPKITIDYDDIVGGFYMSLKAGKPDKETLCEAKELTQFFFAYIEKWQETGLNLDDIEYLENGDDAD